MDSRDVKDYLNLPYHFEIVRDPNPDLPGWVATVKELPGCIAKTATFGKLNEKILIAMSDWIETAFDLNIEVPLPREEEEYSGKFNTRLPRSLHRKLVETAEIEGVSLNQWISSALAEAVGKTSKEDVADQLVEILSPLINKINALEERIEGLAHPLDLATYRSSDFASNEQIIINKYIEQKTRRAITKEAVGNFYYSSIDSEQLFPAAGTVFVPKRS